MISKLFYFLCHQKFLLKFSFTTKTRIHKWNSRKILAKVPEEELNGCSHLLLRLRRTSWPIYSLRKYGNNALPQTSVPSTKNCKAF